MMGEYIKRTPYWGTLRLVIDGVRYSLYIHTVFYYSLLEIGYFGKPYEVKL